MGCRKLHYIVGFSVIASFLTTGNSIHAQQPNCASMEKEASQITNLIAKKNFLEKAVEQCSQDADLHFQLGYLFERLRKYDKAIENYRKASDLAPKVSDYQVGIGDVYMNMDKLKEAILAYEKGLALNPKHERAQKQLEVAHIKQKSQTGHVVSSEEIVKVMTGTDNDRKAEGEVEKIAQPKPQVVAVTPPPSPPQPPSAPVAPQAPAPVQSEMGNEVKARVDATPASETPKIAANIATAPPSSESAKTEITQTKQEEQTANAAGPLLRMQIPFNSNSTDIDKGAVAMLQSVGTAINHERLKKAHFEISGHTDDRGSEEYNMELGMKRAASVKAFLVEQYKIDPNRLTVTAYGKSRPLAPNDTPKNMAINRRVEFRRIQ